MTDLNAYDGLFLDLVALMSRVEKVLGNESEIYDLLDEVRISMIDAAPAGWSAADAIGEDR